MDFSGLNSIKKQLDKVREENAVLQQEYDELVEKGIIIADEKEVIRRLQEKDKEDIIKPVFVPMIKDFMNQIRSLLPCIEQLSDKKYDNEIEYINKNRPYVFDNLWTLQIDDDNKDNKVTEWHFCAYDSYHYHHIFSIGPDKSIDINESLHIPCYIGYRYAMSQSFADKLKDDLNECIGEYKKVILKDLSYHFGRKVKECEQILENNLNLHKEINIKLCENESNKDILNDFDISKLNYDIADGKYIGQNKPLQFMETVQQKILFNEDKNFETIMDISDSLMSTIQKAKSDNEILSGLRNRLYSKERETFTKEVQNYITSDIIPEMKDLIKQTISLIKYYAPDATAETIDCEWSRCLLYVKPIMENNKESSHWIRDYKHSRGNRVLHNFNYVASETETFTPIRLIIQYKDDNKTGDIKFVVEDRTTPDDISVCFAPLKPTSSFLDILKKGINDLGMDVEKEIKKNIEWKIEDIQDDNERIQKDIDRAKDIDKDNYER